MTETVARLRIALVDTEPEIWREVDVPVEINLKLLHDVIQAAMGWMDYHLWQFDDGENVYGILDPDWPDENLRSAKATKLETLIRRGVKTFGYTYDMGDDWLHRIEIEAARPGEEGTKYPRYVDGALRAPPEDCGGIPGFYDFLEAISNPGHPGHKDAAGWHKEAFGEDYDLNAFDGREARYHVAQIAKRRAAGKKSRTARSRN